MDSFEKLRCFILIYFCTHYLIMNIKKKKKIELQQDVTGRKVSFGIQKFKQFYKFTYLRSLITSNDDFLVVQGE